MHKYLIVIIASILVSGCGKSDTHKASTGTDITSKYVTPPLDSNLTTGKTYLPVYSQIYMQTDKSMHDLTVSVSIRNISPTESVYIETAEFYDTKGELLNNYFEKPVLLAPLETVEIVVHENDRSGGTGGNFIFNWSTKPDTDKPLFQAVMISTTGQQGLSFTTDGIDIIRK